MKKTFTILFIILFSFLVKAQLNQYPLPDQGRLEGGLGLNWIDGQLYYTFHFTPEISFANFGVGLDLMMDFDKNGYIRKENFNTFSDYLSVIRYVRYGLKNDPVYAKIGALDYYTMGHGSIMYAYNNSPTIDARKTGLNLDIDFGQFGFESIYSSFSEAGLLGIRGYVRPLQFTSLAEIPIIGNLEVGVSYAGDFNDKAGITAGNYDPVTGNLSVTKDEGSVNIIGADIGLPLLRIPMFNLDLYTDYAKILNFGDGVATGIIGEFNSLGLITAHAKLERRFNNKQYIPSYFGPLYEIERFRAGELGIFSKIQRLELNENADNGIFGELGVNVLGIFDIIGSYQRLDKTPKSGILHMSTEIAPEDA
ncbi:MAG TPA: hypothetical protein VLB50_08300, partial [Ignavibacteriaceae bacterium]|nr:hypothetical protein [Ignavibacteriaceae bacterium]